jgi:hypothetical protein
MEDDAIPKRMIKRRQCSKEEAKKQNEMARRC